MYFEILSKRQWWLAAIVAVSASGAIAADCDMRMSNSVVDYGVLSRGELDTAQGDAFVTFGIRKLLLTAVCQQATTMVMRFDGEPADLNSFRFASNGRFTVKISDPTLDGHAVQLEYTKSLAGGSTAGAPTMDLRPSQSITIISSGRRAVGEVFSAQIEIETYIDDAATRVRSDTVFYGTGTLSLEPQ